MSQPTITPTRMSPMMLPTMTPIKPVLETCGAGELAMLVMEGVAAPDGMAVEGDSEEKVVVFGGEVSMAMFAPEKGEAATYVNAVIVEVKKTAEGSTLVTVRIGKTNALVESLYKITCPDLNDDLHSLLVRG